MQQTKADQEIVNKLLDMIKNKKLEVRVYRKERLHAKAYIFELDANQTPAVAIVGSSNLSISGISEHSELNLKTREPSDAIKLLEWFDEHWQDSESFTGDIADILKNSWAGKRRKPIDVYHKALAHEFKHKFDTESSKDIDKFNIIELFDFQKDAVIDSLSALEKYGGIIVADVVGLGKSYIGVTILKYLQERDRTNALIICPPQLQDMWREYVDLNDINARIISRGKLSTGKYNLNRFSSCNLVLIDESHNFRNRGTNAYEAVEAFTLKNSPKVILLTATPLSNSILDLKHQLQLFPGGDETRIPPADEVGLEQFFRILKADSEGGYTELLREFLHHVMIRRTRKFIIENYAERDENDRPYITVNGKKQYFPERNLSNPEQYDIDEVYTGKYDSIAKLLGKDSLKLARYIPGYYLHDQYKDKEPYSELFNLFAPISGLVRIALLKRMESSVAAFASSIRHYKKSHEIFLEYLNEGIMPIGKDFSKTIYEAVTDINESDKDIEINPKSKSRFDIKAFDIDKLKEDLIHDIGIFSEIESRIPKNLENRDDKLHKLTKLVSDHADEKILVFTESKVTAEYIGNYLRNNVKEIDKKLAIITSTSKNKMKTVKRFDPEHNPGDDHVEDPLSILVSTDVLSEGVNLQVGRMVINYDFHWNPTKLIQRVGRIDRIGSPHDEIDIYNFLPNPKLEGDLNLKQIVEDKIKEIDLFVGKDNPILTNDEQVNKKSMYAIYSERDENILDADIEMSFNAPLFEADIKNIRKPDIREKIESLPYGIRSTVGSEKLLVGCEATNPNGTPFRRYYEIGSDLKISKISSAMALSKIKSNTSAKSIDEPKDYNTRIERVWDLFISDIEHARVKEPTKKPYQRWYMTKLMEVLEKHKHLDGVISRLRKFAKRPILDKAVDRKMKDLRDSSQKGLSDLEFLDKLGTIYDTHIDDVKKIELDMISRPRILYSIMVN